VVSGEEWADGFNAALNAHEPEKIAALLTEDVSGTRRVNVDIRAVP
jgi:hypothetical protein